jgi:hypothetical protein
LDNALTPAEIEDCLRHEISSQEKCDKLMAKALDKKRPNQDNITMVLLELEPQANITKTPSGITQFMSTETIEKIDNTQQTSYIFQQNKWFIPILFGLLIILLIGSGVLIYSLLKKTIPEETITSSPITSRINNRQNQPDHPTNKCSHLKMTYIQKVLKQHNYYNDKIDGKWGNNTINAVKQYQRDNVLEPSTGSLNENTCEYLSRDYQELVNTEVPPHNATNPF